MTADVTSRSLVTKCGFDSSHVRFIDVGIREQHMLSMAHGISITDPASRIIIIGLDCFTLRAIDQLNSVAQAGSRLLMIGTDSGICETYNGATHQSSVTSGSLICMPGLEFFEPGDCEDIVNCMDYCLTKYDKPYYIRLHSGVVSNISASKKVRNVSSYVAFKPKTKLKMIICTCGINLQGAIDFALKKDKLGIGVRVINVMNPNDSKSLSRALSDGLPVLTIYNGKAQILQSVVARAAMEYGVQLPMIIGHGYDYGTSGSLDELIHFYLFDSEGVSSFLKGRFL